jgi:hypothetical protein
VAANRPLSKLQNPVLKRFLQKYTNRPVPDESTLRKNYVPNCYNIVMKSIENRVSNNYLWVSADETTDILGRCVTNIIIRTLHPTLPYTPYLTATKVSTRINAEIMSTFINESLNSVLKSDRNCQNTILFISDAAAYMIKTGKLLKAQYPNMSHITCIAHALHRICEYIRDEYPDVDKLISLVKKIFLKAPHRISLYKEKMPHLPLPPNPVITRWGT